MPRKKPKVFEVERNEFGQPKSAGTTWGRFKEYLTGWLPKPLWIPGKVKKGLPYNKEIQSTHRHRGDIVWSITKPVVKWRQIESGATQELREITVDKTPKNILRKLEKYDNVISRQSVPFTDKEGRSQVREIDIEWQLVEGGKVEAKAHVRRINRGITFRPLKTFYPKTTAFRTKEEKD